MITIRNERLSVSIEERGAEPCSIHYDGVEYLWQADAAYWPRHAPVLFPVVGALHDDYYIFNQKVYRMGRHGFARDKMFSAVRSSDTTAVLRLSSDEETMAVYPFRFDFEVIYDVQDAILTCRYRIRNPGSAPLFFSVGGHPAFNVPLRPGLRYEDYFLEFEDDQVLHRHRLQDGLVSSATEAIPLAGKRLPLKKELFYQDAIVLKDLRSHEISLRSDQDARGLRFRFSGFPYFGIWAAKGAPFVCLEPWCGVADGVDHDHHFETKEGIQILAPGDAWEIQWSVVLF